MVQVLQPASWVLFINSCLLALCPMVKTVLKRGYSSISPVTCMMDAP